MIKKAYKAVMDHKWEIIALYVVHLLYGLLVGSKFSLMLEEALGQSLAGDHLSDGYDSNIMSDLMRYQGLEVNDLLKFGLLSLLPCLLLSVLVTGGVIANISRTEFGVSKLLKSGLKYFIKNIGVSILSLLAFILLNALLWGPFLAYSGDPLQTYDTEKPFIHGLIFLVIISLIISSVVSAWSIRAKSNISTAQEYPLRSAAIWVRTHVLSIAGLTLITLFALATCALLMSTLSDFCGTGKFAAYFVIILTQLMVYIACGVRLFFIGGIASMPNR